MSEAWTDRPDRGDGSTQIAILRSRPAKTIGGIITSIDCVGAYTHYWKGRTCLCTHPNCDPCDASRAPRWYGYLAVVPPNGGQAAILEITPSCVPALDAYRESHGTLRGALIKVQRANAKINARVICTLTEGSFGGEKLPTAPNVKAQLCKMWEVPSLQIVHPESGANGQAELLPGPNGKLRF